MDINNFKIGDISKILKDAKAAQKEAMKMLSSEDQAKVNEIVNSIDKTDQESLEIKLAELQKLKKEMEKKEEEEQNKNK